MGARSDLRDHIYRRYFSGVSWNVFASVISQGSMFASSIVTARLMGTSSFGEWSLVQSTSLMLVSVASAGMSVTASKVVSENLESDPAKTGRLLALSTAVSVAISFFYAVLFLCAAPWIAENLLHAFDLTNPLRISSVYVFFWSFWWNQIGVLNGLQAFSRLAKVSVIQAVASLLLTFGFTWRFGIMGAALAMSFSAVMAFWFHRQAIRTELSSLGIRLDWKNMWKESPMLYLLTLPSALSGIAGGISVWACNTMLSFGAGGIEQLALFNASNILRNLILFVPGLIARVASPLLSSLIGARNLSGYRQMVRSNFRITVTFASLMALLVSVFAGFLLKVYGSDFAAGSYVLILMSIAAVLETVAVAFYQSLFAHGRWWTGFLISGGWSLILVATFYFFTKSLGAEGLAIAYVSAWVFSCSFYGLAAAWLDKRGSGPTIIRVRSESE